MLATFAVIVLHCASQRINWVPVMSHKWAVLNIYDSLSRWCVPVFVMISGALFLDRDIPIKKLYRKYVLRMIVTYVLWSLIYIIYRGGSFSDKLQHMIEGRYHMWFLPMIIGLYMLVPVIKKLTDSKKITVYYLLLAFVFVYFIPSVFHVFSDLGPETVKSVIQSLNVVYMNMYWSFLRGHVSYFVLGLYLKRTELTKTAQRILFALGIPGFVSTVLLTKLVSLPLETTSSTYYDNFSLGVLFESAAIFVFF